MLVRHGRRFGNAVRSTAGVDARVAAVCVGSVGAKA
jgi:hypothetical protein